MFGSGQIRSADDDDDDDGDDELGVLVNRFTSCRGGWIFRADGRDCRAPIADYDMSNLYIAI